VKSVVEKINETRVKISIDVTFDELAPFMDDAYKAVAARVNIPGFRKGKVPQAMIDQRVGRAVVLDEAINSAIPSFYSQAARENDIAPIGRPSVDIKELKDKVSLSLDVEVDVRPDLKLPNFSEVTLTVEDVEVTDAEIEEQVTALRARFGTLTSVEKAVENGDFVSIDLVAKVDGDAIEGGTVNDVSYEVGSNRMVDGLDEALQGLKEGESKRFSAGLVGMAEGQTGDIDVTVKAVKRRDLPDADDAFAKMASEFETLAELRADIATQLNRMKESQQGAEARDLLVEKLMNDIKVPVPQNMIDDEVNRHLEGEGRLEDAEHRAEVIEQTTKQFAQEIIFDTIVDAENVSVNEAELTEYLFRASQRYGMTPDQFVKEVTDAGQVSTMIAEVARAKALAGILGRVKVVTKSGKVVDLEALRPKTDVVTSDAE
jgi:trigger factor